MTNISHRSRCPSAARIGWYAYDWANSPFSTSVLTVFLAPYLTSIARAYAGDSGIVHFAGLWLPPGSIFPYVISLSLLCRFLLIPWFGIMSPILGGSRRMLGVFAYLGAACTLSLYWLQGQALLYGAVMLFLANVCFGISVAFYNALLPRVAPPGQREDVSGKGWAVGYIGGGIALAGHLILLNRASSFGLDIDYAVRVILLSSGLWWSLFTILPLTLIPGEARVLRREPSTEPALSMSHRLLMAAGDLRRNPVALRLLIAYTIYEIGVESVMFVSVLFGREELHIPMESLTAAVLLVQFVGPLGPFLFNIAARALGTLRAVVVALGCWIVILIYAYVVARTALHFFVMASAVAIVMGGTESLSRALFANAIPKGLEAAFFGLREAAVSGTSWLGPLMFGLALQWTGSFRAGILSLVVFFASGAILLLRAQAVIPAVGSTR